MALTEQRQIGYESPNHQLPKPDQPPPSLVGGVGIETGLATQGHDGCHSGLVRLCTPEEAEALSTPPRGNGTECSAQYPKEVYVTSIGGNEYLARMVTLNPNTQIHIRSGTDIVGLLNEFRGVVYIALPEGDVRIPPETDRWVNAGNIIYFISSYLIGITPERVELAVQNTDGAGELIPGLVTAISRWESS